MNIAATCGVLMPLWITAENLPSSKRTEVPLNLVTLECVLIDL